MKTTVVALALLALLAVPAFADEIADAGKLAAEGDALLAKADLAGALKAYAMASKADPENAAVKSKALQLKRVLQLRKFVAENEPGAKWEKTVVSLHVWYRRNGLPQVAHDLDLEAHGKADSKVTASLLSETLLDLGKNDDVIALLGGGKYADTQNHLYLGIARARCGMKDDAVKSLAAAVTAGIPGGAGIQFDLARIHALLGDGGGAVAAITSCLEQCPPRSIERVRDTFAKCPDVQAVLATDAGRKALATESKIEESGCSGGTDGCGSCPKRGGCGSEKKEEPKKEGCDDCDGGKKEGCGGCDGK